MRTGKLTREMCLCSAMRSAAVEGWFVIALRLRGSRGGKRVLISERFFERKNVSNAHGTRNFR
jgi:hypothetical protein